MPARLSNPFTTIRSEGALLPPELLQRVADGDKELKGLRPTDYSLAETERLGEAISRSWNRLTGVWAAFAPSLDGFSEKDPGTGPTREKWLGPLFQELDFGKLRPAKAIEIEGKSYPISHRSDELPVHLVGAGLDLDRRAPGVAGAARTSPHSLLQELLNRTPETVWGVVSNGRRLRLLRDNVSLTRQAFVEFDLESMFAGEVYSDFALLWLLCHRSRFEGERPEDFWLERWSQAAQQQGTRALDTLRQGVERAISALGSGFLAHTANAALRERLRTGKLSNEEYYRQLLRLVYRLIFLFVAEDRDLLHPPGTPEEARGRYRDYYSTARLRSLAERRRGGKHPDLYESLKLVTRKLGEDDGGPPLALPALGSLLWSGKAVPDLDDAKLPNQDLLGAVRALAFTTQGRVLRGIDYRNMGSEELGSIYESLLELHPKVHQESGTFHLGTAAGHERKTTGSYYTPTALINALLDSALDPVLGQAASTPEPEKAILRLRVLDPACGSGHFLVATAHRIAKRLAAARTGDEEASPEAYRTALRDVIGQCLYGIDVNPMAVELCKVSLWLEAVEPGKPLSFLDHHILCGNSLLGASPRALAEGIPDIAFEALIGDDRRMVSELKRRNSRERKGQEVLDLRSPVADLTRPFAEVVRAVEEISSESLPNLRVQEELWTTLESSPAADHARLVADAWCSAFVIPKLKGSPVLTQGIFKLLARDPSGGGSELNLEIRQLADQYRFLHPHLAFPSVFRVPEEGETPDDESNGWSGGFDLVLGNPPWEQVLLNSEEFFAVRLPDVAQAPNAARRAELLQEFEAQGHPAIAEFREEQRRFASEAFFLRRSGRFPKTGGGRINTYSLFAELASHMVAPAGCAGLVVLSGILTDLSQSALVSDLLSTGRVIAAFDFENGPMRDGGRWFPAVDSRTHFTLLAFSGREPRSHRSRLAFSCRSISDLTDASKVVSLTTDDLHLLSPNTASPLLLESPRELSIALRMSEVGRFLGVDNPALQSWDVKFEQHFNASSASSTFLTLEDFGEDDKSKGPVFRRDGEDYWPLFEAKLGNQFNHRYASFEGVPRQERFKKNVSAKEASPRQLMRPDFYSVPRYWVPKRAAVSRGCDAGPDGWNVFYRFTAYPTNERTLIAWVAPGYPGTHITPRIKLRSARAQDYSLLVAGLNSFAADFFVRRRMSRQGIDFFILRQVPLPHSASRTPWEPDRLVTDWISLRVLELTFVSWDLTPFARDLGWEQAPFRWDPDRRTLLRAELDAAIFHLYGLDRDDTHYVLQTFPIVRRNDERTHGEYRTKRLILERYETMAKAVETGESYETPLDPPPADPQAAHSGR